MEEWAERPMRPVDSLSLWNKKKNKILHYKNYTQPKGQKKRGITEQ